MSWIEGGRRIWRRPGSWARRLLWRCESAAIVGAYRLIGALPVDAASALGGFVARLVGPLLGVSRIGRDNLRHAFPDLDAAARERILREMWDNLGRYVCEYPHLGRIWDFDPLDPEPGRRIEIDGVEQFLQLRDDGRPGLIFSGHLANWEMLAVGARAHQLEVAVFYRPPNNPDAERLVTRLRGAAMGPLLPIGIDGLLAANRRLEEGGHVGMLIDQHFSRGIVVPFFGRPAATVPVLARMARRFECPVHGARVERLTGARFRITVTPPLDLPRDAGGRIDVAGATGMVTAIIESWVRERPGQWLWVHRRWRVGPPA